ncbi:MAG: OPT family oligopeptide transporter [Bradymonadia bacterium]
MNGPQSSATSEQFAPLDLVSPQLTIRAIFTGMFLGAVLSLCNIYAGLKIGWGFNMSITAALLGYAFWQGMHKAAGTPHWGVLESNINQTAASSAASISSAGLVAPIPALTMITGQELSWGFLTLWVFSVSLVGVVVATGLRRQMLLVDKLPFPNGIATAVTLKEMYAKGSEALARVMALVSAAVVAGLLKVLIKKVWLLGKGALLGGATFISAKGTLAGQAISGYSLKNLTFAWDPSGLLIGVGALIGFRAGLSMLIGAVVAWGVVAPYVLDMGWIVFKDGFDVTDPTKPWYGSAVKWLLWPGVAMMVTASLTSFAFSWKSVVAAIKGGTGSGGGSKEEAETHDVPRKWFIRGIIAALILATMTQITLFDIIWWTAIVGVFLTFLLAIVAGRVAGETGVTPVGAMGKVTQLMFGVISPGNAAANLMAANVTGGASSQCADMLHDMKTGLIIGASPRFQALAQIFGVLAGSLAGAAAYLILVPDPQSMLLTDEWPAPAVAAWKAVAELMMQGLDAMPEGSIMALAIAGGVGVVLAILEKVLPAAQRKFVPSPAAIGLAFVIPGWNSISMFIGGLIALVLGKVAPTWTKRFLIVIAAGVIAGESLVGVGLAIEKILAG